MELIDGIWRRVLGVGQILALLAALFLAVNPHPLHAQSDEGAGHQHFGSYCEALDTEKSSFDGDGGQSGSHGATSHGDCIHHFDPMVQAPAEHGRTYASVTVQPKRSEPRRQQNLGFDPPPPRFPS